MAIKTFTAGAILTAADTNEYLANSGLVYVTSGALSGSSTNFAGCFDNTKYVNYRIVIDGPQVSASATIHFRMLSGTTPSSGANEYNWGFRGIDRAGASLDNSSANNTLGSTGFTSDTQFNTVIGATSMDVYRPHQAVRTYFNITASCFVGIFGMRFGMSEHNLTTAYDGIQFLTNSAATMGGTVSIYGYRNP
jgi:hypothetical protein